MSTAARSNEPDDYPFSIGQSAPLSGGALLPGGIRIAAGASLQLAASVESLEYRIYRGQLDIGGVERVQCRLCWTVLIAAIGLIEEEQRLGIGARVLEYLRGELPACIWCTTAQRKGSNAFWARMQQIHPDEYRADACCDHITAAV